MSRLSKITFVGMLALTVAGCGDKEESNAPTPSTTQPIAKVFDNQAVVNQPLPGTISMASVLIQPTNVNQRAKQVQTGRPDPFAGLFAQPIPGTVAQLPRLSVPEGRQTVPGGSGSSRPNGGQQNSGSNSGRQQSNPNIGNTSSQSSSAQPSSGQSIPLPPELVPNASIETATPPPPQQPDLASNVAVTGVIQIGSESQAIVLVPNEGTSRYVRVGQRLSNGQVLVKRIEMNEGSDPIVILEQYGIEVARAVGEKPVDVAQAGTSTDSSQIPQTSPNAEETGSSGTTTDGDSVPQPLDNNSAVPTNTTPQSVEGSTVPTNTTVPQSVEGSTVPTNTTVPQSVEGSTIPTNTTVPQLGDDGSSGVETNTTVPQSVDGSTVPTNTTVPQLGDDGSSGVETNTTVPQSVDNDPDAGI